MILIYADATTTAKSDRTAIVWIAVGPNTKNPPRTKSWIVSGSAGGGRGFAFLLQPDFPGRNAMWILQCDNKTPQTMGALVEHT
jgi:hypothetical protein